MIIRAVSDDDDDDHDATDVPLRGASVFGADPPLLSSPSPVHAAKLVWMGTMLALVALLLVDLAAVMSHFQRRHSGGSAFDSDDDASTDAAASTRDPFALLALLLDACSASGGAFDSVLSVANSATALNNAVGFVGVAAWMYSREASIQGARTRECTNSSAQTTRVIQYMRSPWTLVAGVVCFGHVVTCAYVLLALLESNGDRHRFFLGKPHASRTHPRV